MPRFITIGYGDAAGYNRTAQSVRDAAHAQDAKLRSEGAVIGIAGNPVQVRNPEARDLQTRDGPFMSSALPINFTPSMSLFVECDTEEEVERLFAALSDGGSALMPLGDYGFSRRFGWVADRFGITWQLNLV